MFVRSEHKIKEKQVSTKPISSAASCRMGLDQNLIALEKGTFLDKVDFKAGDIAVDEDDGITCSEDEEQREARQRREDKECNLDKERDRRCDEVSKAGEDIAEWRKFHQLHNWMMDLYVRKGGVDPELSYLRLTSEDLDALERAAAIIYKTRVRLTILSSGYENDQAHNIGSIEKAVEIAREEMTKGKSIWYYASW